jgi:hypothetical protein
MILTENYIQRLRKLAGIKVLVEADNRKVIVDKIKLPQDIADWAHQLSDKYSIWIANTFKGKYFDPSYDSAFVLKRMQPEVRDAVLKMIEAGKYQPQIIKDMIRSANAIAPYYTYILDWLRGRNNPPVRETDKLDFGTLTYEEALRRAHAWHHELKKLEAGKITDEDGKVVMSFPDGFYWINLGKSYCEKEATAMGHCARANGILYSLRKDKYPYITVDLQDGVIKQIKGRANTKPKEEYYPYILAFIMDKKIGVEYLQSSYRPETDFNINDLTDEQLIEIANKKPSLFEAVPSALMRLPDAQLINLATKFPEVFRDAPDALKRLPAEMLVSILKKHPDIVSEKLLESMLTNAEMKIAFENNPTWTDSVYLQLKYRGYEGVKDMKKSANGGFEPDGVEILFDDWTDESLLDLFKDPKQAGRVASWELDFYGYDFKYGDIQSYFDDLKPETIAYVKYLLKKAFTEDSDLDDKKKKVISSAIQKMTADNLSDLIGDPDEFRELNGIEDYNEHIVDTLKDSLVTAAEDAQRNADEGEYWKLFTKPVEDLFGKPDWKDAKVKVVNKETGKTETKQKNFLRFKMPYSEFLDLLSDAEEYEAYNHSNDEGSYEFTTKHIISPVAVIQSAMSQREEKLDIEEPYYGVNGDIEKEYIDERFSEKMHEDLYEELKNAKVVKKKKKA